MYFSSITALALLAAIAPATASPLEARQGGAFVAVGFKYSGPGCTASTLINADPIFGNGNVCQPLDRFDTGVPIRSYNTSSVSAGCSGEFPGSFLFPDGGSVLFEWAFELQR